MTVAKSITHDSRTNRKTSEAVFGTRVGLVVRRMRYQATKMAAGMRNTHTLFHRSGAGERMTMTAAAAVNATRGSRGHRHAEKRGRDHVPEQLPPSERKQSAQAARHGDQRREPDAVSTSSQPEPKNSRRTVATTAST